jgi:DNA-binding transcriptional MerR regulator
MVGAIPVNHPISSFANGIPMLTIGQLARKYSLSRSALIYYDKLGVLSPNGRSYSNYRLYSDADQKKLDRIVQFRSAGLSLETISHLLDRRGGDLGEALEQRLSSLNDEIQALRNQQKVILNLLENTNTAPNARVLTKAIWISILKAAGLDEAGMKQWHIEFEKTSPEAHQDFLESIGIDHEEIQLIRDWSRSADS